MKTIYEKLNSISEDRQKELLMLFKQLKSISDKLRFWETNFGLTYYQADKNYIVQKYYWLSQFLIHPNENNRTEMLEFNNYLIQCVKDDTPHFFENYDNLVSNLGKDIAVHKNKKLYIREISNEVSEFARTHSYIGRDKAVTVFGQTYEKYVLNETEPDLADYQMTINQIPNFFNGITYGKFKLYLENLLESKSDKKRQIKSREELTTNQKILLLEKFGILDQFKSNGTLNLLSNKELAIFLSYIFGNEGFENIRKSMTDVRTLETKQNLNRLVEICNELNLKRLADSTNKKIIEIEKNEEK